MSNVPARHRKARFDYRIFSMFMSMAGVFFVAGLIVGHVR